MPGILLFALALLALATWSSRVHRASLRGRCLRQETLRRYLANED